MTANNVARFTYRCHWPCERADARAGPEVAGIGRCHQQMDVVVHQYVRMQQAGGLVKRLGQQVQIEQPVVVIEKA